MTVTGWLLVVLSGGLQVAGTLLLRAGVDRAGGFAETLAGVPQGLLRLAGQAQFDIGFVLYGLAALVWFRVLSTQPLGQAYPVLVSLTFVFVSIGAAILFQEPVTARKVFGLAIILLGVLVVGRK